MASSVSSIIKAAILVVLLVYVSSQDLSCKDTSAKLLCDDHKAIGKCNETMVMTSCAKTCGVCSITTTTPTANITANVTTTKSPVPSNNTDNSTKAAVTKPPTTLATNMSNNATTPETTMTTTTNAATAETSKTTTTSTTTTSTTTTSTTTTSTTTVTTPTTTLPIRIRQIQKAVKAHVLDGVQDYNMNLTVIFIGHVNVTAEHEEIEKAVVAALSTFGMTVDDSNIAAIRYGVSSSIKATSVTSVTWKLMVVGAGGENASALVHMLNDEPSLAFTIETGLAVSVETTLYGKDDFMETVEEVQTTTEETEKATEKEKGFRSSHWNVVGIAIGTALAFILLLFITAIVQYRRSGGRRKKMDVAEGTYDFEISIAQNNNSDPPTAKTHL